jgi:hypothetical protein
LNASGQSIAPSYNDVARYFSMAARAHFTVVSANLTPDKTVQRFEDYVPNVFRAARETGMKVLVYDGRFRGGFPFLTLRTLAEEFSNPEVYGFFIDEPSESTTPRFAEWTKLFNSLDTTHPLYQKLMYVNLFGHHAKANYDRYVEHWIAAAEPRVLSFDNYALWDDVLAARYGSATHSDWTHDYYLNLEYIRQQANAHTLPFWTWVLVHRHWSDYANRFYRRATPADLRFQIYASVAYGAKGILYYNFWNPPDARMNGWHEEEALLDYAGEATDLYAVAAKTNQEILAAGDELLACRCVGVYHATSDDALDGGSAEQRGEALYSPSSEKMEERYGIKLASWDDRPLLSQQERELKIVYRLQNKAALAGILRDTISGAWYVVLVNKDRKKSSRMELVLDNEKIGYQRYAVRSLADNRRLLVNSASKRYPKIQLTLEPGDGVILALEKL